MSKRIPSPEGAVLRFFRGRRGLTREELARRAGVSVATATRWETGDVPLDRRRLVEILALLDVPPEAVDAALFADGLANPPGGPGQPTGPSGPEDRLITRTSAAAGWATLKAIRAELHLDHLRRQAPRHRQWAEDRWARIKKLDARQQTKVVEALLGDERSWALAERIALASEAAAAHRAAEALRLARLAVRVAGQIPGRERWRLRFLGWAEAFLGNALRVGGDLAAASKAFAHAEDLQKKGEGGDPAGLLDGTRPLDLKASLLMYQGCFEEARSLLDQALEGVSTEQARGRLLIKKANIRVIAGEYQAALETLDQAESLIAESDREMLFSHRFNRAASFCHLGLYENAESLLGLVATLAADLGKELHGVRVMWLEGRTYAGLGRREEAFAALSQVRRYFLSNRIAYDFALVSVELGTLYLEQGRTRLVRELAEEMLWIFKGQGVHKEALAALALFCQTAQMEEVEAEWTRRLVKYLYCAQHNPHLCFEP